MTISPSAAAATRIPRPIWILGCVSLLMDVSSEMIHGLLPVYLVTVLGASALTVGVIEGVAEATASITKVFSGALSDWLGRRKWLTAFGYGLAALSKPVFALAPSVGWLFGARFVDRVGKGIRGAPRDAMIADLAPQSVRGASFGLRQALDTVGAFLGPLLAIAIMAWTHDSFRTVFWWAVPPAFLSLLLIAFAVREPAAPADRHKARSPLSRAELRRLSAPYWWVVALGAVFTLARFSEAFLILRAQGLGLSVALAPLVLVLMNGVYSLAAYPAGAWSDRMDRSRVLVLGLVVLIAADIVLAWTSGLWGAAFGIALWGLHMGLTQGLLSSLVADTAPEELRGTAFGFFNLVVGAAMLAASVLAGALWDAIGPATTFAAGAAFAALTLCGLLAVRRRLRHGAGAP